MEFNWYYMTEEPISVKDFLKQCGISRRLLAKIKFQGGFIFVNGIEKTVRHPLKKGDCISIHLPQEDKQETIVPVDEPIDILFEDDHFLAVNKPCGISSIPSFTHPFYSMANRVKGYYVNQQYVNQMIHVVTRLDKDTTGVMLFAKHTFAHGQMDEQLRAKKVDKQYLAIVENSGKLNEHGLIDAPIQRSKDSIMKREVGEGGKQALSEYWLHQKYRTSALYRVKLHTGRTHQIRVHFQYMNAPLIGDSLYGGTMDTSIQRQALHCHQLTFTHPFTQKELNIIAPLPKDLVQFIESEIEWTI